MTDEDRLIHALIVHSSHFLSIGFIQSGKYVLTRIKLSKILFYVSN